MSTMWAEENIHSFVQRKGPIKSKPEDALRGGK